MKDVYQTELDYRRAQQRNVHGAQVALVEAATFTKSAWEAIRPSARTKVTRAPRVRDPFWQGVLFIVLACALLALVARCAG